MTRPATRWRNFHTDELRAIHGAATAGAADRGRPEVYRETLTRLRAQLHSELALRGVPEYEMDCPRIPT